MALMRLRQSVIDALSLTTAGVPAVALNGVKWPAWLPKAAAFRQVYIGLDADDAGDDAAEKLAAVLTFGSRVERLRPDPWKDWNEALLALGVDQLSRVLFDHWAAPRWVTAWWRRQALPHPALEAAIDTANWLAFNRELAGYEGAGSPSVGVDRRPANVLQMELEA